MYNFNENLKQSDNRFVSVGKLLVFFIEIQWFFSSRHFTFHLCGCRAALDLDTCQINITVFLAHKTRTWHTMVAYACRVCVFFPFIIQNEHQIKDSPVHSILCNRLWCCTHEMRQVRIWLTFWWFILWIVLLFEPFKNDGPLMGVYHEHIIDRTFRYERERKKTRFLKLALQIFGPEKGHINNDCWSVFFIFQFVFFLSEVFNFYFFLLHSWKLLLCGKTQCSLVIRKTHRNKRRDNWTSRMYSIDISHCSGVQNQPTLVYLLAMVAVIENSSNLWHLWMLLQPPIENHYLKKEKFDSLDKVNN